MLVCIKTNHRTTTPSPCVTIFTGQGLRKTIKITELSLHKQTQPPTPTGRTKQNMKLMSVVTRSFRCLFHVSNCAGHALAPHLSAPKVEKQTSLRFSFCFEALRRTIKCVNVWYFYCGTFCYNFILLFPAKRSFRSDVIRFEFVVLM